MLAEHNTIPIIKHVGANGQISLGKRFAGKQVSLVELEDGSIVLKPGKFIPDNEMWLYANNGEQRIDKALEWYENSQRQDNFIEIEKKIKNG